MNTPLRHSVLVALMLAISLSGYSQTEPATITVQIPDPDNMTFVILEDVNGIMPMPAGWFTSQEKSDKLIRWHFTRENPEKTQKYQTGLRLDVLHQVQVRTGQKAKDFLASIIDDKRKTCGIIDLQTETGYTDGYQAITFETHENGDHRFYRLLWHEQMDIAAITTAATPEALWPVFQPVFLKMKPF